MKKTNPLDYFAGGVPASAIFQMAVMDIQKYTKENKHANEFRTLPEICFIGLVSYFEAFCKDCFASIINIAPSLLKKLKKDYEIRIDPIVALEMRSELTFCIGFLVTESQDFGTARKINALYNTILGITPFNKKEETEYNLLLSDRNLLVHHGGIYTQSYIKQRLIPSSGSSRLFFDSLRVDISYLDQKINFLLKIAKKIVKASKVVLTEKVGMKEIKLLASSKQALKLFDYWDEEQIVDG